MAGVAAVVGAVAAVGGAASNSRNQRRALADARQANEAGAVAADPASHLRPEFQDILMANWPNLSGVNFGQILQDPSFKFLKERGETAAVNQASASGLLRSGTLLEDLSTFNQDLASTYIDKQFARNMSMLGLLGNFSGLNMGNPGVAGNIISSGGMNIANMGYNMGDQTNQQIGGAISQIGRLFPRGSGGYDGSSGYSYPGGAGTPGGNWDNPG